MAFSPELTVSVGLLIRDKKLLLVRAGNDKVYMNAGGKLELGESPLQALTRELHEELGITISTDSAVYIGEFRSVAFGRHDKKSLLLNTYIIEDDSLDVHATGEISELKWASVTEMRSLPLAPVISDQYLPWLEKRGVIA